MTQFYPLTVSQIEHDTEDAVIITFAVPAALAAHYRYRPGQHLTLKIRLMGEEQRRCYSICSGLQEGRLQVAVKRISAGHVSSYINDQLQAGDQLEVMTPQGVFGYQPLSHQAGEYLAIAAGSGITPLLSIISSTLAIEKHSRFTLIYGNRTAATMMFRQALADLKDRYPSRLQLIYLMSREGGESPLLSGRVDRPHLEVIGQHLLAWSMFDQIFLCGPENMMDEVQSTLLAADVAPECLHRERFLTRTAPVRPAEQTGELISQVTLWLDGRELQIQMEGQDSSILEAALRQGADMPYACKGGVCATCKCRLLSGQVTMATNYSLEQDQLDAGFILSCQSLPLSERVELDFDR